MKKSSAALATAWVIAAVLVAVPYVMGLLLAPDVAGELLAIHRLDRLRPVSVQHQSVVFVGSSMTDCAVPYDQQFEAQAARHGLQLDFVRITAKNGVQEDFADEMDRIARSNAGLILVSADMLLRQPSRWKRRVGVTHWTHAYMLQIQALRVTRGLAAGKSTNTGDFDCGLVRTSATDAELDVEARRPRELRTDPWQSSFRALFNSARGNGRRVVVVVMGRSPGLESRLDPGYRRQFEDALQRLQANPNIRVWVFPSSTLPNADYSDGAHLNARGRQVFTQWLIDRMVADRAGN